MADGLICLLALSEQLDLRQAKAGAAVCGAYKLTELERSHPRLPPACLCAVIKTAYRDNAVS